MEWTNKYTRALRIMRRDGKAFISWEFAKISSLSIVLQDKTFIYFMIRILKYCISFEAHYSVSFIQMMKKEIVEHMIMDEFLPSLRIYSYSRYVSLGWLDVLVPEILENQTALHNDGHEKLALVAWITCNSTRVIKMML